MKLPLKIELKEKAKNLGVILDNELSFGQYVIEIKKHLIFTLTLSWTSSVLTETKSHLLFVSI